MQNIWIILINYCTVTQIHKTALNLYTTFKILQYSTHDTLNIKFINNKNIFDFNFTICLDYLYYTYSLLYFNNWRVFLVRINFKIIYLLNIGI